MSRSRFFKAVNSTVIRRFLAINDDKISSIANLAYTDMLCQLFLGNYCSRFQLEKRHEYRALGHEICRNRRAGEPSPCSLREPELALAYRFRRRQPAAIVLHRFLPLGDHLEKARYTTRPRILLSPHVPTQLWNRASLLVIIPALFLGAAGCGKNTPSPATPAASSLLSAVVESAHTPLERDVDGTIEAVNQATVSAQTSGRVVEI